jgi:hypothetical protein
MAANHTLSELANRLKVLERQKLEAERRSAALFEEKSQLAAECESFKAEHRAHRYMDGDDSAILGPNVEVPARIAEYLRTQRTLLRNVHADLEASQRKMREVEQHNDILRRKLSKYRTIIHGPKEGGPPRMPPEAHRNVVEWAQGVSGTDVIDLDAEPEAKRTRVSSTDLEIVDPPRSVIPIVAPGSARAPQLSQFPRMPSGSSQQGPFTVHVIS